MTLGFKETKVKVTIKLGTHKKMSAIIRALPYGLLTLTQPGEHFSRLLKVKIYRHVL